MSLRAFVLLGLLLSSQVMATPLTPKTLAAEIETLLQHSMPLSEVGIAIIDAQSGKTLYERNSHQPFTPASNTKVLSAMAALLELGPEYQYYTSIKAKKSAIKNKTLNSNLYIQFSGDPSLQVKHIKELIKTLKTKVHTVKGSVIIDSTRFNGPVYAPGWSQEDLSWYFNAPLSAVILEQNTIDANLIPGLRLGNTAKLKVVDKTLGEYFPVSSNVVTVTYPQSMKHCSLYPQLDQQNQIRVSGCWPISDKARTLHFAIKNPELLAKKIIANELKTQNIKYQGNIKFERTPSDAQMIAMHKSPPLKSLLRVMLKDSNNIYAESFTKTLGHKVYGTGSFQEGVNVIKNVLHDKANIDPKKIVLHDGSGASRYNLVSPRQLARVLFVMGHTPKLNRIFQEALPESGQDGTLRNRMKSFDLKNKLFAKTGSMGGVSTLAGYMTTRDNNQVIFAIMMNHVVGKLDRARLCQAQIASIIYAGEPWDQV